MPKRAWAGGLGPKPEATLTMVTADADDGLQTSQPVARPTAHRIMPPPLSGVRLIYGMGPTAAREAGSAVVQPGEEISTDHPHIHMHADAARMWRSA